MREQSRILQLKLAKLDSANISASAGGLGISVPLPTQQNPQQGHSGSQDSSSAISRLVGTSALQSRQGLQGYAPQRISTDGEEQGVADLRFDPDVAEEVNNGIRNKTTTSGATAKRQLNMSAGHHSKQNATEGQNSHIGTRSGVAAECDASEERKRERIKELSTVLSALECGSPNGISFSR